MDQEQFDMKTVIRDAISEFVRFEQTKAEPAYKAELTEERKRREQLEQRLNELVEENKRSRQRAEEMERSNAIRSELQRLGVNKVDLAFRAVKDEVQRAEDGRLIARTDAGEVVLHDYLRQFVSENPELLPARMVGGSGANGFSQAPVNGGSGIDLDKIKPGMSAEELDRVRHEISRVASQTLRAL